jgi:hypothetical protein
MSLADAHAKLTRVIEECTVANFSWEAARPRLDKCKDLVQDSDHILELDRLIREARPRFRTSVPEPPDQLAGEPKSTALVAELLDSDPVAIRRPLALVTGTAYAAAWPPCKRGNESVRSLVLVRKDGQLFTDVGLAAAQPIASLGFEVCLREIPPPDKTWSGAGIKRYVAGARPDPAEVFARLVTGSDYFLDFDRSLGPQRTVAEMHACYIMATYFLDAFSVIGYLWPTGERGSGKTHFLSFTASCAYLGQLVLSSGTFATLRDLADYGATLAFDDCETLMDARRFDPDKRNLMLAGNRRGPLIPFKEPTGPREWKTRYVNGFCAKCYSAIRLPDPVLASRSIMIPMVRSLDEVKTNRDPADFDSWPFDHRLLIDDLWATGLAHLAAIRSFDQKLSSLPLKLSGRNLEPWRAILALALFLQEERGLRGLFDRMHALAVEYQGQRSDLESDDKVRVAILGLDEMLRQEGRDHIFETSKLSETMNRLAAEEGDGDGKPFTNAKSVGRLLRRLRFEKASPGARRRWWAKRRLVDGLAKAYGVILSPEQNEQNARNAETQSSQRHFGISDVSVVSFQGQGSVPTPKRSQCGMCLAYGTAELVPNGNPRFDSDYLCAECRLKILNRRPA